MSNNNNANDYNEREGHVLQLYDQGKSTRDIAKELRMSQGYRLYSKKGLSESWNCNNR
jgi:ATP/maltotriose-dependent transcriptional regulator MalT